MSESTVAENPAVHSSQSLNDPTLGDVLPAGMQWLSSYSGVVGSALLLVFLWLLADPGLTVYGTAEATPLGADAARYAAMVITGLGILLLWPLVCALGLLSGFTLYLIVYQALCVVYLYPFHVLQTALFALPERWAYEYLPKRLLNPERLRADRRDDVSRSYLISSGVTMLVYCLCVVS